jgi:hypothetical protein
MKTAAEERSKTQRATPGSRCNKWLAALGFAAKLTDFERPKHDNYLKPHE